MSKEKKYEINYTGNGKSCIIYDNHVINISLLDDFIINVISGPIKTYVTIDEDKLKATLEKYKTDKYSELAQLLDTNVKLIKSLRQYIDTKIQKSFDVDFGRSDKLSDRLMTETVIELQLIIEKIDNILESTGDKDERKI